MKGDLRLAFGIINIMFSQSANALDGERTKVMLVQPKVHRLYVMLRSLQSGELYRSGAMNVCSSH